MFNRRKKSSRMRASNSHGWGAKKKHRGAGHRGGRGNAGSGKRGDAKKPSFWKDKANFGKDGFKSKSRVKISPISLLQLNLEIEKLCAHGLAVKENTTYKIDLAGIKK
ncbi:MAG: uL15 family ribosomal protein, partial [Candidatus Woesearchaeota archaeon]